MIDVSLNAGKWKVPAKLRYKDDGTIDVLFPFNRFLIAEFKAYEGGRWNPETKCWNIKNSLRNDFQLAYLQGLNPYAWFDRPLIARPEFDRPVKEHQVDLILAGLTYHYQIFAAEMGTGKTLAAIEVMERSGFTDWIWVGPKSALRSVQLDFRKWEAKITPKFLTYDGLKKFISEWPRGKKAPHGLVADESSRCRNPATQRSQAIRELAIGIRGDWGYDEGYVLEMSGTPAPKNPVDWWHQCEIACPGFIKEGTREKFKSRLSISEMRQSIQGGSYPHHVTWLDNEEKCGQCGQPADSFNHTPLSMVTANKFHKYTQSVNEAALLYERMKGLVTVKLKKDCLDLPDKHYDRIIVPPSPSTLRSMSIIQARSKTVISALIGCRQLSDGFQYIDEKMHETDLCPMCHGTGEMEQPVVIKEAQDVGEQDEIEFIEDLCPQCQGSGDIPKYKRETIEVPCPKDDVVRELLDEYDDVGRTVFWGGFEGTIKRLINLTKISGWDYFKVDGKGWETSIDLVGRTKEERELEMLEKFQDPNSPIEKLAFIGQPAAGGMGLTLTRSPMECFFSNDFNAESRGQAEDRIHRIGMDVNRGARIIDLIHLPTDTFVLESLIKKIKLQAMTMGQMNMEMTQYTSERRT